MSISQLRMGLRSACQSALRLLPPQPRHALHWQVASQLLGVAKGRASLMQLLLRLMPWMLGYQPPRCTMRLPPPRQPPAALLHHQLLPSPLGQPAVLPCRHCRWSRLPCPLMAQQLRLPRCCRRACQQRGGIATHPVCPAAAHPACIAAARAARGAQPRCCQLPPAQPPYHAVTLGLCARRLQLPPQRRWHSWAACTLTRRPARSCSGEGCGGFGRATCYVW